MQYDNAMTHCKAFVDDLLLSHIPSNKVSILLTENLLCFYDEKFIWFDCRANIILDEHSDVVILCTKISIIKLPLVIVRILVG
jgi:hypothetical protein